MKPFRSIALAAITAAALAGPAAFSPVTVLKRLGNAVKGSRGKAPAEVRERMITAVEEGEAPRAFDAPDQAAAFEAMKRRPAGSVAVPVERYLVAREHNRKMPQYSSAAASGFPSQNEIGATGNPPAFNAALSTWNYLGPGNVGGRTRNIVFDKANPNTMYAAGGAGGVWRTTDGGGTWAPVGDLLPNMAVNSLAIDPRNANVLYAGTGEGYGNGDAVQGAGIFKSTDAGATWTALTTTTNSPDFRFVNKLLISPVSSNRVYAATRTGILRSLDSGATWSLALDSTSTNGCMDLAARTDQTTDYIFAACGTFSQGRIYRNTDAGAAGTWTASYTESRMGRTSLSIAPSNQNVVFAMSASNETGNYAQGLLAVFRTVDSGATWTTQVRNTNATKLNTLLLTNSLIANYNVCAGRSDSYNNQGWYDNIISVDPADSNVVWAGGADLFRSDDGGASWGLASYWWAPPSGTPGYAHADNHAIVFHPQYNGSSNQILFVGNDGGVFKTANARAAVAKGTQAACNYANTAVAWTSLNNSFGSTQFHHGAPYPDGNSYFGGTQDNGTVRGTNAGGPNGWQRLQGGDGGYVAIDPATPTTFTPNISDFRYRNP